ncbi:MAG TPA: hypothetical protein PKV72_01075 [Candidatus Peribacteria bacterium]|nr:hypothetical protein [Candidatus Peribacteria bacterium]
MKLLDRYVGAPAQVRTPAVFAQMLAAAGKNVRGKVTSLLTADDWDAHVRGCVAAIGEEGDRQGVGVLHPDQQKVVVRVETGTLMVQTLVRRMLAEVDARGLDFIQDMEPEEARNLGAGYTLRRRKRTNHFAFHNHGPQTGFPVDAAIDAGDGLLLFDVTASQESWRAAVDVDHQRLVPARQLIRQAGGADLQKFDVLLDEGGPHRADRMRKEHEGIHAVSLPLREEVFALADTTFKRVRPYVMTAPKTAEAV